MSELQDVSRRGGRRKRALSAEEKLQIWLQLLTGELTQRQAAERWGVDPTTIMRIRRVGREGALTALAKPRSVNTPFSTGVIRPSLSSAAWRAFGSGA